MTIKPSLQNVRGSDAVLEALMDGLGREIVGDPADFPDRSFADWSGAPGAVPVALIRPRTTQEVSDALAICNRLGQPVVIQGGLTGLAGGASAQPGEVVLSTERMNSIEAIDELSATMTVQAGAKLHEVQEGAAAQGLNFALDLGARGSCTIGGNIATNAGGVRVIKYGMMREQVLGIEAVLADGRIVSNMDHMLKNNSGYDFRNLLAGSEGTLAVITRAVLRLRPAPRPLVTAWCGVDDFDSVGRLLIKARAELPDGLAAFEVMWASFYEAVITATAGVRPPLAGKHAFHVLLETSASGGDISEDAFIGFLGDCIEAGIVSDAAVAQSEREAQEFWAIRESPQMFTMMPNPVMFDISAATSRIGDMAEACQRVIATRWPDSQFAALGHMGDGNLHLLVGTPDPSQATHEEIEDAVCETVEAFAGSISAEHGIGIKKRRHLHHTRSDVDVALMRAVKTAFDPRSILGRGRIFMAQ